MAEFTRKQLTIIFKIAFLEAMALSIIMPSVTSSGEISSTNPFSLFEKGSASCTIGIGQNVCSVLVTYPTPFPVGTQPNDTVLLGYTSTLPLIAVQAGTISFYSGTPIVFSFTGAGEEFGAGIYQVSQPSFIVQTLTLTATCTASSATAGSLLILQYSQTIVSPTWFQADSVPIDSTTCASTNYLVGIGGIVGVGLALLRVVSSGGTAGSSVTLTEIHASESITEKGCTVHQNTALSSNTRGVFSISCLTGLAVSTTFTLKWTALECTAYSASTAAGDACK